MVVAVSSDAKGLYALGILSHEASIIAAKESTEMKTIDFFIPRKLSLMALNIQSHRAMSRKACRIIKIAAHIRKQPRAHFILIAE
jgi:hypothetical protein